MQGVKYLLTRIMQLEGDKALLMDEYAKLKQEIEQIKEVIPNGNDGKGNGANQTEGSSRPETKQTDTRKTKTV